ncbi:MAG: septation protein A [Alphaproteobacteria bacterium]|jgi:intracellular septation protein|nr:septation protein A [Alphaproteobacteria bacterium]PPR13866.1 MAG: putative intracellular septation protein A [Alphaproteobacteria bacterium MarineAlpha12_Bin1]|tara:strand:+ start:2669 stop:3280 length:612 start_codon:yes stop_codon:yes gene_type:complete
MKNWLKLFIEAGPLIVFFVINGRGGLPELRNTWSTTELSAVAQQPLFEATGAFMLATIIALIAGWVLERRLPMMPLVSGVFVIVFGGLTLILADETFIKIKPTLVNCLFAVVLIGGLAFKKSLLKPLFGSAFQLSEKGWRLLTLRWGGFFILLAFLNEVIWRNFSTDFWISFKLFGILPLTLIFAVLQTPLVIREQDKGEDDS